MTPDRLSQAFAIAQMINDKFEPRLSVTLQVNILAEAVMWMRLVGMGEINADNDTVARDK